MDPRDLGPEPTRSPLSSSEPPEPDLEPRPPVITPDPLQTRLIPGELAVLAVVAAIVLVGVWVGLEFVGMVGEAPDPSASPVPSGVAQASPSPAATAGSSASPSSSVGPSASPGASPSPTPASSGPLVAVEAGADVAGRWRRIREAPIGGRTEAAAAWTGQVLLVWGGFNGEARWGDGAAYDPDDDTWRRLPKSPLSARRAPASAWSGDEFLVWGGSRGSDADDGAAYDPASGTWRSLPPAPLEPGPAAGAWTNAGFLVVTGAPSAALYDPETDAWTELAPPPLDPGRMEVVVVTGRAFVVRPSPSPDLATQVALLVRADRSWRRLDDGPPSDPGARAVPAEPFVLLGNLAFETSERTWRALDLSACAFKPSSAASLDGPLVLSPTGALEVAGPACRGMPAVPGRPEGGERVGATVVWTGREWIAWSGAPDADSTGPYASDGVAFAPAG